MERDIKRYDLFGWDYEGFNPLSDKAVRWYLIWAGRVGGPVLELACGSGRMLVEIAKAGYEVVGIDLSERMLELARDRISVQSNDVQGRIRLYRRDMADFDLSEEFGMVMIGDNSLRELAHREQQLACLRCVRRHLERGGRFLVTERRLDSGVLEEGRREYPWSHPVRHPETGEMVSRKVEVWLDEDRKWLRGMMTYRLVSADGKERVQECPFEAPVLDVHDYLDLFKEAGFDAQVFVGYEEREDDGEESVLCFVCNKKVGKLAS